MWWASETIILSLLHTRERLLMRTVVVVVLAAHVLNKSLETINLGDIPLYELPDFEQRLILIRAGYCHEPVDVRRIVALVFCARRQ